MHPLVALPAIAAIVYRAYSHRSLTPLGLVVATATAAVHALHPWSVFFSLLGVFFLGGTAVTKVKSDIKASRTLSSSGHSGGEGPRSHVQVLANSLVASLLVFAHYWLYPHHHACFAPSADLPSLLVAGVVSNYAAVAADTFASELGILSQSPPRLVTSLTFRVVPPGTNGGVTLAGTLASLAGSSLIAASTLLFVPFCAGTVGGVGGLASLFVAITLWGGLGSLLDSFLGGWLQSTVVDRRTGKVVEGEGGRNVPYRTEGPAGRAQQQRIESTGKGASRYRVAGTELLDNNGVNLLMAALMSVGGMAAARWWWSAT